jgi:hypothetical protein
MHDIRPRRLHQLTRYSLKLTVAVSLRRFQLHHTFNINQSPCCPVALFRALVPAACPRHTFVSAAGLCR